MDESTPDDVELADQYEHGDGTVEVVFATEVGRVLTVREYPDVQAFRAATTDAKYRGTHAGVADLPGPKAFLGEDEGRHTGE